MSKISHNLPDVLLNDYFLLSNPSRGTMVIPTLPKRSLWDDLLNRPKVEVDKVDSESYKKIGLQILEKLKDFRSYFPFNSSKKEKESYFSEMQDYVSASNDIQSIVSKEYYYNRLNQGFSKLDPQVAFNKVLTRIKSSPKLQASFLESIDSIVAPYDLLITDLIGYENLLFPDSVLDSKNLDVLKKILSRSFSHEVQKQISSVSEKLDGFIRNHMDSESASTEEEVLKDFIDFIEEPKKSQLLHQTSYFYGADGKPVFTHEPEFQKMIKFLQNPNSSITPSFISKHIANFFPNKTREIQDLWIKFLGLIRDGNDPNFSKSDFSQRPDLEKLFNEKKPDKYPALIHSLKAFAFLYERRFELNSPDLREYINSLSELNQILGDQRNPMHKEYALKIIDFFQSYPNFNEANLEQLGKDLPSQISTLFNIRNLKDKEILWNMLRALCIDVSKIQNTINSLPDDEKKLLQDFSFVDIDKKIYKDKDYIYRLKKLLESFDVSKLDHELQNLTQEQKQLLMDQELITREDDSCKLKSENLDYLFKIKSYLFLLDKNNLNQRILKLNDSQKKLLEDFGLLQDSKINKDFGYLFKLRTILDKSEIRDKLIAFDENAWEKLISNENHKEINKYPSPLYDALNVLLPQFNALNVLKEFDSLSYGSLKQIYENQIDTEAENLFKVLQKVLKDSFVDNQNPKLTVADKDKFEFQYLNKLMTNSRVTFEMMKFFRDNPNYSQENINKIDSVKIPFLKEQFEIISQENKSQLYSILSDLANANVPDLSNAEKSLIEPLKEKLDDFDFITDLNNQILGFSNSRFKPRQGKISISNDLIQEVLSYTNTRNKLKQKLTQKILSARNTRTGIDFREEIESKIKQISKHFWENGILEPSPKQVVDYIKTLQGTHIGRRKFLAVAGAALLTGAGTTLGVNKYNEVQYQEYLAKDFKITNTAINDPGRHLLYPDVFLQDLNKFLNSLKRENEQFNKAAKETLFGEGNLDIPELIDLEPGSIIVPKNFAKRDFKYSFKEINGRLDVVVENDKKFSPTKLKEALKTAGVENPDAINPQTNKSYYETAKAFFISSFQEGRKTDRSFCPFYPFINPQGKLRIIVEPVTANLSYSPFKNIRDLNDILVNNPGADLNSEFYNAFYRNLELNSKLTSLENNSNLSQDFSNKYRDLLKRHNNAFDLNNPEHKQEYEELIQNFEKVLTKKFDEFRAVLKRNPDSKGGIEILKRELHVSLKNYFDISNLASAELARTLGKSMKFDKQYFIELSEKHNRSNFPSYADSVNQFTKDIIDLLIKKLTEDINPRSELPVA